jgi:hypothetical protein
MLGAVALVAVALLAIGLALDIVADDEAAFWIGAEAGGALAIGAVAGAFVVAVIHVRDLLSKQGERRSKGGRHV